jgi:outer membrane receptor protein involved in Fe transport
MRIEGGFMQLRLLATVGYLSLVLCMGVARASVASESTGVGVAGANSALDAAAPAGATQTSDAEVLQEVVVTAQKRTEKLQDVPLSITVLPGSELDTAPAFGMSELLSRVPGVSMTISGQGGFTVLGVRGVTPAAANFEGPPSTGFYLDSVPFSLVKTAATPDLDPYDLQRVEVLRGPQGVFYGAASLNGVVRVLTQDADPSAFDAKGRLTGSYTENGGGNGRADAAINVPLVDNVVAARLVLGYASWSGWIDRPNETNANSAQLSTARLKVDAQPTPDLFIGLSYWYSRDSYADVSQGYTYHLNSETVPEPMDNGFDTVGLKVSYKLPAFSITSATSYMDYKTISLLDEGPQFINAAGVYLYTGLHSDIASEEINLVSSDEGNWLWSAGGIYRYGKDVNDQSLPPAFLPSPLVWTDESKSYALYGQVTLRSASRVIDLSLGARYFHDHVQDYTAPGAFYTQPLDANFSHVSPRVALTWHPSKDLSTYVSYSNGFRSGFGQGPLTLLTAPNLPPVQPDKLDNYEIGAKGEMLNGLISFDTSVYYMKWKDVQQNVNVYYQNLGAVTANVNGPSASGTGVDFLVTLHPVTGLSLSANGSWNNLSMDETLNSGGLVYFEKGDRLVNSPEWTAGLIADYNFPLGASGFRGQFSVSGNYTSKYYGYVPNPNGVTTYAGESQSFARTSFTIQAPRHWSASAFVENLNNYTGSYAPDAPFDSAAGPEWHYPDNLLQRSRPRTYGLQIEYHLR